MGILLVVFVNVLAFAQEAKISGVVSDSKGGTLPGVSVVLKGTTNGTVTDIDGKYVLGVPAGASVLVYSFVGMQTQEINVSGRDHIDVVLQDVSIGLDELVVVGYGTQKKANLTGSVASVDAESLENRAIASVGEGLQGLLPNLNVNVSSGEPGNNGISFNIRGFTSINGGSPLILVDGVEQDIQAINPDDIQSVSVLKDAASAAIYGARAAFGVVLVTTKQAEKGKPTRISYSGSYTLKTPTKLPSLVNDSYKWATSVNKAMEAFDGSHVVTGDILANMKAYSEDPINNPQWEVVDDIFRFYGTYNWKDELLRSFAPTQQHNVKVTGGSEKTSYYTSVGYLKQEGLYRKGTDGFDRFNVRMNVNSEVKDWLDLSFKVAYNNKKTDRPHLYKSDESVINSILFSRPNSAKVYPGSEPEFAGAFFQNPATYQEHAGRDTYQNNDLWLTTGAKFKISKQFSVNTDFSYNIFRSNEEKDATKIKFMKSDFSFDYGNTGDDYISLQSNARDYYSMNAYTQYENTFNQSHYIKVMAGFNQEWTHSQWHRSKRKELISSEMPAIKLALGDQEVFGGISELALRGLFYRVNYIYNDKYLFEMNGRYDGTSRYPSKDRFGFFPSFSAGWRVSEEEFMKQFDFLDNFKLRASYGTLGNQKVGSYYPYIPSMGTGNSGNWLFSGQKQLFVNPPAMVSPTLTWEESTTSNIGLDLTLFNNHLDFTFDKYTRTTSSMLMKRKYPSILGTSAPYENGADLQTKGWELAVTYRDKIGSDFNFDLGFTLSDAKAKITKFDNPSGSLSTYYEGKELGEIWGYETQGIFQSKEEIAGAADQSKIGINNQPGDIRYTDQITVDTDGDGVADAGDGVINKGDFTLSNHGDLKVIGNTTPRYRFGFTFNGDYKNFFVNVMFQGIAKRDFWPSDQVFWPFATQYFQVQKHFITDSWSEDNRSAYFGRPLARDTRNRQVQSRYIQDASYVRLKNFTIGYNLPKSMLDKVGLQNAKIYLSGSNLWEYSNIKEPFDPEAIKTGSGLLYPFQRSYTIGVNLTF